MCRFGGMLYEDMKDGIISRKITRNFMQHKAGKKNAEIAIHQIELEMEMC